MRCHLRARRRAIRRLRVAYALLAALCLAIAWGFA